MVLDLSRRLCQKGWLVGIGEAGVRWFSEEIWKGRCGYEIKGPFMDFILFIVFLYVFGIFAIALRSERFV